MEKDNFLDKLKKLVEVAKTKHNALDITEINDFFKGENLSPEKMEQIYSFLEEKNIDVVPVIDDAALADDSLNADRQCCKSGSLGADGFSKINRLDVIFII